MAGAPHAGSEAEILERHAHDSKATGKLRLQVVAPTGQVATAVIDEVTAPGVLGEFGVLPGHVPFLSALKPGVLSWKDKGGAAVLVAVDRGYLQVGAADKVVVLVERAAAPDAVDVDEARATVARESEAQKQGGLDAAALELSRNALAWAEAQLDAHARAHGKGGDAAKH